MTREAFPYAVTGGWIRDLASQPRPHDAWPCIAWDDALTADQERFLGVQRETGVAHNVVWGLFVDREWPVPLRGVVDEERRERLRTFVDTAHEHGVKVLSGVGVYSWGFERIIREVPGVSAGLAQVMCAARPEAWDWQRRVLDFVMDPDWGLDGVSMQSADQGRCTCDVCSKVPTAEYHANLLVRCAEYVRAQRPDWVIGQAAWGMDVSDPGEFEQTRRISQVVDYMVEVSERSADKGLREKMTARLGCAFGSVGGVFVEPPQHWDRLRWFVPCGLGSARALARLWADGGRACEYFYRPFANPVEEVSWRAGARILSVPATDPLEALKEAVSPVYGVSGADAEGLARWFERAEAAYFSRADFRVGDGPLSLEPLIWKENAAAPGPPVYLERLSDEARTAYAAELRQLKEELSELHIPNAGAAQRTAAAIEGTLRDIAALG